MNRDVIIREASNADLEAMLNLYNQADMDDGKALALSDAKALFDQVKSHPFYRFYVAITEQSRAKSTQPNESHKRVIGVFGLLIMPNLGHQGAPSAIVEGVCVHPADQGTGVGRHMMQHAMDIARQHGCYKLALTSNIKRERAHAFYASLGFDQHGMSFQVGL